MIPFFSEWQPHLCQCVLFFKKVSMRRTAAGACKVLQWSTAVIQLHRGANKGFKCVKADIMKASLPNADLNSPTRTTLLDTVFSSQSRAHLSLFSPMPRSLVAALIWNPIHSQHVPAWNLRHENGVSTNNRNNNVSQIAASPPPSRLATNNKLSTYHALQATTGHTSLSQQPTGWSDSLQPTCRRHSERPHRVEPHLAAWFSVTR